MTAAYTKGKTKYYMYYRCIKHVEKNFSGEALHKQFEELLSTISFTSQQLKVIGQQVKTLIKSEAGASATVITLRKMQLNEVQKKIDKVEEKFVNDQIERATYSKWQRRYQEEKAVLEEAIKRAKLLQILKCGSAMKRFYHALVI